MGSDPHLSVTKREDPGNWAQTTEALTNLAALIRAGATESLLGNRAAQYTAQLANTNIAATFWRTSEGGLYCQEPVGVAGPLRLSVHDPLVIAAKVGPLRIAQLAPFDLRIAAPIMGADGLSGLLACNASSQDALGATRFIASAISALLTEQRELPHAARELLQHKEPLHALPSYFSALLRGLNRSRGAIFVRSPDGSLRVHYSVGVSGAYLRGVLGVYLRGAGGIAQALRVPVQIDDALQDARSAVTRELMQAEGIRSVLLVPILYQGAAIAGFTVYGEAPGRFSPQEVARADAMGSVMGPIFAAFSGEAILRALPISLFYRGESGPAVPLNDAAEAARESVQTPSTQEVSPRITHQAPLQNGALLVLQDLPKESLSAQCAPVLLSASRALRDPLTVIWGYLGMIEGRMRRANPQDAPRLQRLQHALQRLAQLADELHDLSQENTVAPVQRVDLCALLASLPQELGCDADFNNLPEAPLYTLADHGKLLRVISVLTRYVARFTENLTAALPILTKTNNQAQLLFSTSTEGGHRFDVGLGVSRFWLDSVLRQWGGSLMFEPEEQPNSACLLLPLTP